MSITQMDNPYASSVTNPVAASDPDGTGSVTPHVIQALAGTKPWVRFCSILGFVGTGLMALVGLAMLGLTFFMPMASDGGGPGAMVGFPMVAMAAIYFLLATLYLFPSIKLWKYGTHILNLMHSQSVLDLEAALEAQRAFWKFVGIVVCIMIGIYVVAMVVAVFGSVFMARSIA